MKTTIRFKEHLKNGKYPAKYVKEIIEELDDRITELESRIENQGDSS